MTFFMPHRVYISTLQKHSIYSLPSFSRSCITGRHGYRPDKSFNHSFLRCSLNEVVINYLLLLRVVLLIIFLSFHLLFSFTFLLFSFLFLFSFFSLFLFFLFF